jgi:hypothetical protein
MQFDLLENKNFWSGVMLIATGAAALLIASDYRLGTAFQMGPGYVPTVLGGIIVVLGIIVLASGLRQPEPLEGHWSPRALVLLPLALVLFGFLMEYAGFVPAMLALTVASSAAGKEFRILEALVLAVLLTLFSALVFIGALGLPFQLVVGW